MMMDIPFLKSRKTRGFSNIIPVLAQLLIALMCIVISVGAMDAQNDIVNSIGVPVGNLTVVNSTPTVSVTYEPTATPISVSLASIDNTTTTVQEPVIGDESVINLDGQPVVTAVPLATSNLLAEDPIKATSTVASPSISATESDIHPLGAAPVAFFVSTPASGMVPSTGFWNFDIRHDVVAIDSVKINGNSDDEDYLAVTVSNDIDTVTVEFDVVAGYTTPVTITKRYIDRLKGSGGTPMLHAWGATLTYDVDAGVRSGVTSTNFNQPNTPYIQSTVFTTKFTPLEHLKSRGTSHHDLNKVVTVELGVNATPSPEKNPILPASRHFIMGPNDAQIPGTDIWVNANATLNNLGSTLSYAVTVGASQQVPGIFITPQIWKHIDTGDVPVYTGSPSGCWEGTTCVATGAYMPSDSGTYYVNATVLYTSQGYTKSTKSGDITVSESASNVVLFGDTTVVTHLPLHTDYATLGGASAIRRDGSLETFIEGRELPGNDWVKVTNGAAITRSGELVTWIPGLTASRGFSAKAVQASASSKKYIDIAQFSNGDWLLAIYEDEAGATHLEARGNYADHPEVLGNVSTGTGWKMIAAGNNHALALRSDGTLVAWGKNDFGQLNLTTDRKYTDVDAGEDFSIGMTADSGQESTIVAVGNDDYHQVSGVPAAPDHYIQIAAGKNTAAALTHDGHIIVWGQQLPGLAVPTDGGYTDIQFGPDYGIALRETAPEYHVTGPLSPGMSIRALDGTDVSIPFGSSFEHTHNDVTRVFAPDGTQLLWANDENATQVKFPAGAILPLSVVHYIPSGSTVDATVPYHTTVTAPSASTGLGGTQDVMTVSEDAWYDEVNPSLPRAMCFADTGCSAGVTAKQQLFLSEPRTMSAGDIPVFSVHQTDNNTWVGTLGKLGSSKLEDTVSMIMEKTDVDPNQQINFSIISSNWGAGTGPHLYVTAQANLTPQRSHLHYTITGTASKTLASISLTPQIWQTSDAGDVLVFTGNAKLCSVSTSCIAAGNFTPIGNATYFANATVLYTLPTALTDAGAGEMRAVAINSMSASSEPMITALNVEGFKSTDSGYTNLNAKSSSIETSKGYNPENVDGAASDVRKKIETRTRTVNILQLNGEGSPGFIEVNVANKEFFYGKKPITAVTDYAFDTPFVASDAYSDIDLTVLYSCHSGETDATGAGHGNLVDAVVAHGGKCVMGWRGKLANMVMKIYNDKFWDNLNNASLSINQANASAADTAGGDRICYYVKNNLPGFNEMCNLDLLYRGSSPHCDRILSNKGTSQGVSSTPTPTQPPAMVMEKGRKAIQKFTHSPVENISLSRAYPPSNPYLFTFDFDNSIYSIYNDTGRVEFYKHPENPPDQKEIINLDQGYGIAEMFAREKFPEFWNLSDTRGTKIRTNEVTTIDRTKKLDYAWMDVYYTPDQNTLNHTEIQGLNLIWVAVSPYTGHVISYTESYHPSVITGVAPVNLTPLVSEEQAQKIAEEHFPTMRIKPEETRLKVSAFEDGIPHLAWVFISMTENRKEIPEHFNGGVVIDAHDGTVLWSFN